MTDFLLTNEQRELQKMAREFTDQFIIPVAREYDINGEFPVALLARMNEKKLDCLTVPQEYGGLGLDLFSTTLVMEAIGYGCAGVATSVAGNNLSSFPLLLVGNSDQKKTFFDFLVRGKSAAFALTEPGAGSDAASVATTAKRIGDEYVINGTKCFCSTGGYAGVFTLFASTDPSKGMKGLSAFIVESSRPGIMIGSEENKLGIRSSNTVELILKDVRVPASQLLGKEGDGFKIAMQTLDLARPLVAGLAVGVAQRALDESVKYVKNRLDGKRGMASNQTIQFRLSDMAIQVEAARQLVYYTSRLADIAAPVGKHSAMCKTFACDTAMRVTADAVEILGEFGYSQDSIVEKLMRDAKVTQIYEGTNQVQRLVIAGHILR